MGRPPHETTDIAPFGVESGRLRPPGHLGEQQKRAFLDLVTTCPRSQFVAADIPLLCRWAELIVMAEKAVLEMQREGMVVDGQHGPKVSPWFAIGTRPVSCARSPSVCSLGPAAALLKRRKPRRRGSPTTSAWTWRVTAMTRTDS